MWRRIKALRVLVPRSLSWRKMILAAAGVGLLALAFFCGHQWRGVQPATANPPTRGNYYNNLPVRPVNTGRTNPGQPVAYVYNGIPITRQDLGEYLIARLGSQRLDFMVNRRILELECQKRGISITANEVEAQLIENLKLMNIPNLESFVGQILRKVGKTLHEYQEDVIWPQLALRKLCQDQVKITYKDLQNAFESKYGPKRQCRIIVFPKDKVNRNIDDIWVKVRGSEQAFSEYARKQPLGPLASQGGLVPPIYKHFPDKVIERVAFSLKEGEVSEIIGMQDGSRIIMKCDKHIPPITNHKLVNEEVALRREVFDRKLAEAIPKYFNEMKRQANPRLFLHHEPFDTKLAQRVNRALQHASLVRRQREREMEKNLPAPPKTNTPPLQSSGKGLPLPSAPSQGNPAAGLQPAGRFLIPNTGRQPTKASLGPLPAPPVPAKK